MGAPLKEQVCCRFCNNALLEPLLFFSQVAIGAGHLSQEESGAEPLRDLSVCRCPSCNVVQLLESISPDVSAKFRFADSSSAVDQSFIKNVVRLLSRLASIEGKKVVEIGSSDGYLLSLLKELGFHVMGFESSPELIQIAIRNGIHVVPHPFTSQTADQCEGQKADFVILRNVLESIENHRDLFTGIRKIMAEDGYLIVEVPDLVSILRNKDIARFHQGHLYYFDVQTLRKLLNAFGFDISEAYHVALYGGSILSICRQQDKMDGKSFTDPKLRADEQDRWGDLRAAAQGKGIAA